MERQMQLYWEAFEELVPTAEIIKSDFNPVYLYEDQFVDGAIVDIGCGQTSSLLRYAGTEDRRLIGIDNEEFQLTKLKSRMIEVAGVESDEWELITSDIQSDSLPDGTYSVVVLYNILHFFSLEECGEIIEKLNSHLVSGSMISVCVHSAIYYANDPTKPENNDYFKVYFTQEDLDGLFPIDAFQRIYRADIERLHGKKDAEVSALWTEKIIVDMDITDAWTLDDLWRQTNEKHLDAEIISVYKKL